MKKILSALIALLLMCAPALAETLTIDLSTATDAELIAARDAIMLELASRTPADGGALLTCEIRGCTVSLMSYNRATGRSGEDGIALFFTITNGTEQVATFQQTAWITAYQGGVECASNWLTGTDSTRNATKVQPGGTSDIANWPIIVTDTQGILEVQICDIGDWRKPVVATMFIDLSQLD